MREQPIRLEDVIDWMRETLDAGRSVSFFPRGRSMLPFLKEGRDSVTIVKASERLKKYDVALYRRHGGQFVLHRVMRARESYTFIGDNQYVLEHGITHDQIIGVCVSFTVKGKEIGADSISLRLRVVLWHATRFPRRVILGVLRRVRSLFKR